jgi:two-component system, chemotaxis family, response regulator PixG
MVTAAWPNISTLSTHLNDCDQSQFTGRLHVWAGGSQQWHLLFCLGRLLWASGGAHPKRRWLRLMAHHCPQKTMSEQQLRSLDTERCGEYEYLIYLARQAEITGQQATKVIRENVTEVLFDILQQEHFGPLSFTTSYQETPDASLSLIRADQILAQTYQAWQAWSGAGFSKMSPNLAPVIRDPQQLVQQLSANTFQTLVRLLDGKHSLRDVACITQQDLQLLAKALKLYIRRGFVEMVPIPDLQQEPQPESFDLSIVPEQNLSSHEIPVIAHVDDSPRESQILSSILAGSEHHFVSIQDSIVALPKLLECKPDLIFLDLFMPVVNGFELCSQIRKTSQLKHTPVIILTSNEGLIDWARAKVVGSTAYLKKPMQTTQIWQVLQQHLPQLKLREETTIY